MMGKNLGFRFIFSLVMISLFIFAGALSYDSQRMVLIAIGDLIGVFLVYLVWIALDNIADRVHEGIYWRLGLDLMYDYSPNFTLTGSGQITQNNYEVAADIGVNIFLFKGVGNDIKAVIILGKSAELGSVARDFIAIGKEIVGWILWWKS